MEKESSSSMHSSPHETMDTLEKPSSSKTTKQSLSKDSSETVTLSLPSLSSLRQSLSTNYWAIATVILALILVFYLFNPALFNSNSTDMINKDEATSTVLSLFSLAGLEAEHIDTVLNNGLWQVTVMVDGQQTPFYITADGEYFASLLPIDVARAQIQQAAQQA